MRRIALGLALFASTATAQPLAPKPASGLYLGADLSYVNEMEACGTVYRANGKPVDPFVLMKGKGGNIVRVRIWNDAKWTKYSDLADVTKTIRRAKTAGMQVLLDFHYSDDWADGEKQIAPAAWAKLDTAAQAKALYAYTRDVLGTLDAQGLMPEMVQVGNETNPEVMGPLPNGNLKDRKIDWTRNATLLNAGIKAVRDAGKVATINPRIMLHIAQPEHVAAWFDAAAKAGVRDFDVIGISYYRKWSTRTPAELGATIAAVKARYKADVIVVETAYPFSPVGEDASPDLLGADSLLPGYPATPIGQRDYLVDLTQAVVDAGGIGVVYWEPGWVSTGCKTRWGTGSNWENAAWFGLKRHEALPAFDFLGRRYVRRGK
ncbi:arabinogalactan endo-1,4-beta-galactosidase [Sphingomonas sp. PP-CE-3A-406]|uniref:glycoside hydrolase family 53 protein n=1 Tax=Sphingomonas sp. PP-CE-3A-406 TaxID=2135659 RepID=UPI000EF9E4EE|nr:glycosyl hydrolase 53 family protein [Sphingomonas sp. PP-CE-3A-406]RMB52169.1 arabinogalactan endo-1,4-beta-galactosidase [Sphingomonas sp. PP-CE-3A-406]